MGPAQFRQAYTIQQTLLSGQLQIRLLVKLSILARIMNLFQLFSALISVVAALICIISIVMVARSPRLKFKALWILGCLFGVAGIQINWTLADDIFFQVGIMVPLISIWKNVTTGHIIISAAFSPVALIVFAKELDHNFASH